MIANSQNFKNLNIRTHLAWFVVHSQGSANAIYYDYYDASESARVSS